MYAEVKQPRRRHSVIYQCQCCEERFDARDIAQICPACFSTDRSNLVILHMEEDEERAEWLALVDFSAGD